MAALLNRLGFRATLYVCPGGWPTIGYGHVVRDHDGHLFEHGIDEQVGEELLRIDVEAAKPEVRRSLVRPSCNTA